MMEDFADPWNFDLRLQKGSQFKKGFAGENVCFISPLGNDVNEGKSVKSPWKTLKNVPDGATVYLLPGTYPGADSYCRQRDRCRKRPSRPSRRP
ncbi:MAG: hypothetical protein IKC05_03795 [Lentisphaeria bacterium]|nr:hypothetical protein [Lentisphaeria bacterium]